MIRKRALIVLAVLALPTASLAVAPLLVIVGRQILHDMILGEVKGQLIGSLAKMGCKGARIASLIATASIPGGAGLVTSGGIPGGAVPPGGMGQGMGGGLPDLAGASLPPGPGMGQMGRMPQLPQVPGTAQMPGPGGAAPMPEGATVGVPTGARGIAAGTADPATMNQMIMAMQAQHGGRMSPEQMARVQETVGQMQEAMEHPLSRAETMGVFDELRSLGALTDSMHAEARDCILLAPADSERSLGASGAMMKAMVLPRLRETKARVASLGPEEQDQLAQGIAEALREAKPADRQAFREGLGLGFFPAAVVEKAGAAAR
jgi:hypothetical protein